MKHAKATATVMDHPRRLLTRMSVLPVLLVLRAAAAHDVQHEDEHAEHGTDGDGHVERVKVPVDVPFEVRIV